MDCLLTLVLPWADEGVILSALCVPAGLCLGTLIAVGTREVSEQVKRMLFLPMV